ncbi:hypothetical protein DYB32_010851 [Aphanomyces invadans]|uniref:Reverse transcriptase domain-containing protein n=1 Tax=Aphanomyces invadans TaxID=157072 RepID=A0A418AEW9_9STRA|nr:hypothetical protein DYB32_010851 [Aphanomyces invadans]
MRSAREKGPGPNALPHKVLRLKPTKWALAFELVFNHQLGSSSKLKYMQTFSTIILLHKKGDRDVACNYRPTNLNNTDVNIIARDPAALITQLELIESFCAFYGFKLNRNKTKLLTYGSLERTIPGRPSGQKRPRKRWVP